MQENEQTNQIEVLPAETQTAIENDNSEEEKVEPIPNQEEAPNETNEDKPTEEKLNEEAKTEEKVFTKADLNNIVRERLERSNKSLFKRYGVENRDGIDDAFKKAASYDEMLERYNNTNAENLSLRQELAFLKNNINPDKVEDIRCYFKGKEKELTEENLIEELSTHQEWVKQAPAVSKVETMGVEHKKIFRGETEEEKKRRIFGI